MVTLKNLQIYLSVHCNLKCSECMYHSQFNSPEYYSFEQFTVDMESSKSMFKFDVAILIGGEPLLNKRIGDYAKYLKENTICKSIQINTNGILLENFDDSLYQYIDRVVISEYPLPESQSIRIKNGIEHLKKYPHLKVEVIPLDWFLRTTKLTKSNDEITDKVWKNCTCGVYSTYGYNGVVFNGKFYRCVLSFMKPRYLKKMNIDEEQFQHMIDQDCMELSSNTTEALFERYYLNPAPLQACYWCTGCSGKKAQHTQMKDANDHSLEVLDSDLDFEYSYPNDRKNLMTKVS